MSRTRNRSRSAIWPGVAPLSFAKRAASIGAAGGSTSGGPPSGSNASDMGQQGCEGAGRHALDAGGLPKGEFLREFEPDFFFDDQTGHIESAARHVPSGHVASGVRN